MKLMKKLALALIIIGLLFGNGVVVNAGPTDFDISTTATNTINVGVTDDTTTNATMYPAWFTAVSGNRPAKVSSTKLTFNPSTGTLTTTIFAGALTGNASGSAATVTGAAQPAITSLGTLTGLTIGTSAAGGNVSILATLGAELAPALTAGNWTVGAGWESPIVGPGLIKNADGTGTQTPSAATTIVAGITYKVVITISAMSVGNINYTIGGVSGLTLTTATTYTEYITANSTAKLIISPDDTSRFTISAISYKALTDATGDLTISGNLRANSPISASVGSINYPGYSFIEYPNTGIYRDGNSIRFAVAGVASGFVVSQGAASIFDGTVSIPGLNFNSDANTGIYRPGTDIFAIATGGVERIRADAAGNILVGVAAAGTSAAGVLGMAAATAPTTAPAGIAQLWPIALNGAGTTGFRFMNEAATTVYTMMGCSATVAVSTGIATTLMGSANIATNAGWLAVTNNLGAVVYVPYWTTATP